ncbi:MAG: Hsp20/alpha crystallin family protein [Synechococcaceae cyanobacterium SM2_3_1]|nr:Hsp20/alpha crystallin family protein [Synechococcaceae cyanobacterium SM2_3_1]
MALVKWQPFRELGTLRRQMDRLFDDLLQEHDWMSWPGDGATWMPAIEMEETEQHLILKAQIPGMKPEDLDVQVSREALSIAGEHRQEVCSEEGGVVRSEFHYGKFHRTVPLPVAIQQDQVTAEFKDGILQLTMPKATDATRNVVRVELPKS